MKMRSFLYALFFHFSLLSSYPAMAVEQVNWQDLGISIHPSEDPFFGRTLKQKQSLEILLRYSRLQKQRTEIPDDLTEQASEARAFLSEDGLDPEGLIRKEERFRRKLAARSTIYRSDLDGKDIRIPGYLIPLEYEGNSVTEFLLVPYAGACIHTPPPPPNQIIHVQTHYGFAVNGLFTPVLVTGKLLTNKSTQKVGLSDGEIGYDVGYALEASSVESYSN